MRRLVLILPGLLLNEDDSVIRERLPSLQLLAEQGAVQKVAPLPRLETPEALYLGMGRHEAQMRQGPLTVSALGADPPERSTHFHLSLLSLSDQIAMPELPTPEEARELVPLFKKLDTRVFTTLPGEGLDHALVWEGLGDLETTSAQDAVGKAFKGVLPEGDNEPALRRFIDDSVNLLAETETNRIRRDNDQAPLNLLWPWGHGVRKRVPNLVLRRGEVATVVSPSLRLAGLTRLTGYRFERIAGGVKTPFSVPTSEISIVVLEPPTEREELEWFARELDVRMLAPWLASARSEVSSILTIATDETGSGLALSAEFPTARQNVMPFDERALGERLPTRDLNVLVEEAVTQSGSRS